MQPQSQEHFVPLPVWDFFCSSSCCPSTFFSSLVTVITSFLYKYQRGYLYKWGKKYILPSSFTFPVPTRLAHQTTTRAYTVKALAASFKGILIQRVIYPVTLPVIPHKAGSFQHPQVLRDRRLCNAQLISKAVDAHRLFLEQFNNFYSFIYRKYLKQRRRFFHNLTVA